MKGLVCIFGSSSVRKEILEDWRILLYRSSANSVALALVNG